MPEFVHLRAHSDYTLSEGASKVGALVAAAKAGGMPAMALTDKDNLFAAMEFSKQASSEGVQPLIGCHLHTDLGDGHAGSFILLAQNEIGYKNLCALVRAAHDPVATADGTKASGQPSVPLHELETHSDGLLMLTGGGPDGLLPTLTAKSADEAAEMYRWLLSVFGDRLYVEICRNRAPSETEAAIEDALIALAYGGAGAVTCVDGQVRDQAPLVATTDVWYATHDRHEAWALLKAVDDKTTLTMDGDTLVGIDMTPRHMRSASDMAALFADLPEALGNTTAAARRCAFMVKGRKPILPPFACGDGRTENDELAHQARQGLGSRLAKHVFTPEMDEAEREAVARPYRDRLEFELGVIIKMGFPGYFLIVGDFIQWAKNNDIPVGPGRGSGAGSVVAWALTITDLDPLRYGLLFERFLNPERVSMPDFDIDFCQDRRLEVVQYVRRKYGKDHVSGIATFGLLKAKGALKDTGRVLIHEQHGPFGFGDINELTKLIPDKPMEDDGEDHGEEDDGTLLTATYNGAPEFRSRIDESPKLRVLYDQAKKIEGLYRNFSTHAAGIIIGDRPLEEYVPVTYDAKAGMSVCSFNMKGAETAGMVKFDFLGLTNLSIAQLAVRYIKEFRGDIIDLSTIPIDDPEVFRLFNEGRTTGVFQFESGFMRGILRQVHPDRLEDLIAINALGRPGPMEYIPNYARRKNGEEEFSYPQPEEKTQPFLGETYGIMVYQEQVMQVARACAGYSLGGADLLRRAMGKKIQAEMDVQRNVFINGAPAKDGQPAVPGAVALGMDAHAASKLFDDIAMFAGYGFNKSHAAAYAWIAYQTMWLKCHYPVEFFSALMSYNTDSPEKLRLIKDELDVMGIQLLPPDVNASHAKFGPEHTAKGAAVRFGLTGIKQISGDLASLVEEREHGGSFTSLEDFHARMPQTNGKTAFNKAQLERLSEAGAFDTLAASRRQAASVLGWLSDKKDKKKDTGQLDMLAGIAEIRVPAKILDVPEWGDVADREFKAVGFYYSRHPIDPYLERLIAGGVRRRNSFVAYMRKPRDFTPNHPDEQVESLTGRRLCAMVDDVRVKVSRRGSSYVEATVSEKGDSYRISCFEKWDRHHPVTVEDHRRLLEGAKNSRKPVIFVASLKLNDSGDDAWVNSNEIWDIDVYLKDIRGDLVIRLEPSQIRFNVEETKLDQQGAAGDAEEAHRHAREVAVRRKFLEIGAVMEKMARADADPLAVQVRVVGDGSGTMLPGRYKLSLAVENVLKTMDGVASIKEDITNLPKDAAPAARQTARR